MVLNFESYLALTATRCSRLAAIVVLVRQNLSYFQPLGCIETAIAMLCKSKIQDFPNPDMVSLYFSALYLFHFLKY